MRAMFYGCSNLEKINFGKINTSSVENMRSLFNGCSKLTSIDLSIFDFSNVMTMNSMFYGCSNLEKVNFGNINTSSVEDMEYLFHTCINLISIDLSNFNTSNVKSMRSMFYDCSKLKYLDLSNFNTQKVTSIKFMFYKCGSLIFLNLKSFQMNSSVDKNNAFSQLSNNIKYCIQDVDTKNVLIGNKPSNCNDDCFKKNIKIDINNNKCVETCLNNGNYEYNNICFYECPKDTYALFCVGDECNNQVKNCYDKIPEKYYLDINDKAYKKCFDTCKNCYGEGNETINNCKECIYNFTFLNETKLNSNCFKICEFYHYFDETNNYACTDDFQCPEK